MRSAVLSTDYLTSQLIAYIGNKRALLSFLHDVFLELNEHHSVTTFLDPFAGSGAVSRLAKAMGCNVTAGDWEPYSYVVTACHVSTEPEDLPSLFAAEGGIEQVLDHLNHAEYTQPGFICRHYAPERTDEADYRTERLFYTRENALFLDGVRTEIDRLYPSSDPITAAADTDTDTKKKRILVALLVYQAATHANTSGVFKAYHKGFGGHGRDSLQRIMAPMQLRIPVLHPGRHRCSAACVDAKRLVRGAAVDLCYLDPPYTTHQYGSNYHMLNTVVRYDAPPVDNSLGEDGTLASKAGIRQDWVQTKSAFCRRSTAADAMKELLSGVDARYIVLSYNTEGHVSFDELLEILQTHGETTTKIQDYVKYRGGKQSLHRRVHNQELVLVVDRTKPASGGAARRAKRVMLEKQVLSQLLWTFHPARLREAFDVRPLSQDGSTLLDVILYDANGTSVSLPSECGYTFVHRPDPSALAAIPNEDLADISRRLETSSFVSRREEAEALLTMIGEADDERSAAERARRLVYVVRKFTFRKYRTDFEEVMQAIEQLRAADPAPFRSVDTMLADLQQLAVKRFEG